MINIWLAVVILAEIAFTLFIVWGFCNEQRFIDFEDRVIAAAKCRFRRVKRNICAKWLASEGLTVSAVITPSEDIITLHK